MTGYLLWNYIESKLTVVRHEFALHVDCQKTFDALCQCDLSEQIITETSRLKMMELLLTYIDPPIYLKTQLFEMLECNSKILYTTATPLQMFGKQFEFEVDTIEHIVCNVGDIKLYSELFISTYLRKELHHFKSLTLLLPSIYGNSEKR
jgi:hypothetical protein